MILALRFSELKLVLTLDNNNVINFHGSATLYLRILAPNKGTLINTPLYPRTPAKASDPRSTASGRVTSPGPMGATQTTC